MRIRRAFERTRDGDYRVRLTARERALVRVALDELRDRLEGDLDDPDLRRLFPPGYEEDAEGEAEYRRLVGDELLAGRRSALRVLEETLDSDRLAAAELEAWLGVLNDARLVLGTSLDVDEETFLHGLDPRDPDAPRLALYGYLSWVQEQAVEAASSGLRG